MELSPVFGPVGSLQDLLIRGDDDLLTGSTQGCGRGEICRRKVLLVDGQELLGAGVDLLVTVQGMTGQGEESLRRVNLNAWGRFPAARDLLIGFQDDLHACAGR